MWENRCMGCMRIKSSTPVCEHCGYDARQGNAPHQLPAGTVLQNQYVVGKVLGQGGFGITYMGWDSNLNIPVAIKEFFPNGVVMRNCAVSHALLLSGEQNMDLFLRSRDRFSREATSLAMLGRDQNIENVVRVQNLIHTNNTAYIIMEYVSGINLWTYIRDKGGTLTVGETWQLLFPLMDSLEKIHHRQIIHRDISPDNIMVLPDGRTKLIDFGAAYAVQIDTQGNQKSTQAILKHGFAPVEQYQTTGELGPWTDVYALCATIYFCLTGHKPPSATDRILGDEVLCWDSVPKLDKHIRYVLDRGLAIHRKDRIQSVKELKALLQKQTSEPPPLPRGGVFRKIVAAAAAVVLIAAAVSLVRQKPDSQALPELTERPAISHTEPAKTETKPPQTTAETETAAYDGKPITELKLLKSSNHEPDGEDVVAGTWEDTFGVWHEDALRFWVVDRENYSNMEYAEYWLNKQYSEFSGVLCTGTDSEEGSVMKIEMWMDGANIFTSGDITRQSSIPFCVDVSGGNILRIRCITGREEFGYCIVSAGVK